MKKKIFMVFMIVLIAIISSCAGNISKDDAEIKTTDKIVEYHECVSRSGVMTEIGHIYAVRHFMYQGHSYIQFDVMASYGGHTGIVHDPDCWCNK